MFSIDLKKKETEMLCFVNEQVGRKMKALLRLNFPLVFTLVIGSAAHAQTDREIMAELAVYAKQLNAQTPIVLDKDSSLTAVIAVGLELIFVADTSSRSNTFKSIGSPLFNNCLDRNVMSGFDRGVAFRYVLRNSSGETIDEVVLNKSICRTYLNRGEKR